MKEISIINKREEDGVWTVVFKHYNKGECACTAKKKTSTFEHDPSKSDLLESIG